MYFRLAAIRSRPMIEQFCSLVRARRRPDTDNSRFNLSDDPIVRMTKRLQEIRRSGDDQFFYRLSQLRLAEDIERIKQGRIKIDPGDMDKVLRDTGLSRSQYDYHSKEGRKWKKLCGFNEGLLCFFPLAGNSFGITLKSYTYVKDDVEVFHELLKDDFIRSICKAGKAFGDSLAGTDIEYLWEGKHVLWDTLTEEDILLLLRPFPSVSENVYRRDDFPHWPRPTGWPDGWPWPANPTLIPVTERHCELCEEESCDCVYVKFPRRTPRIKEYPDKGRGLQAVASSPGQKAYNRGDDLIGYLTGKIVPVGTYDGKWAIRFTIPIGDEPEVCQIYCADVGNCFRLLNHCCKPLACLKQMIVSGRCITAVEAVTDIYDGTEITVSYSQGWARNRKCFCEACIPRTAN
ncbi:hypothetical protein QBC46DRAFT_461189 [Diplogelasinospora grovesii]|uniref:SET domain-containing protein n=1 Tax=Diplogelasinospora grovesii TaxID=303347 RepID=A0AAN6N0K6_9PEZI|nr:hypothetical protein QBC46DRAFT_461189 [Diplogelasinospora grovesii]